jgi:hypothetical protein
VIDRRSSLLLDKSLMVITRIFQPQGWRQVLINALPFGDLANRWAAIPLDGTRLPEPWPIISFLNGTALGSI